MLLRGFFPDAPQDVAIIVAVSCAALMLVGTFGLTPQKIEARMSKFIESLEHGVLIVKRTIKS
jgi:hypothetical protein